MTPRSDRLAPLFALALLGCTGDVPTTSDEPIPTEDTGPFVPTLPSPPPTADPCETPLELDAPAVAASLREVQLSVSGGVGPYLYTIATDASGGAINPSNGIWFPGPTTPTTDVLQVDDTTCGTSATASVSVVPPITAVPSQAVVPPLTTFSISAVGAVSNFVCEEDLLFGGATLVGCTFTAGDPGQSTVRVVDLDSGESDVATITVATDARLLQDRVVGAPVGRPVELTTSGGSGQVDLNPPAGVGFTGSALTGSTAGTFLIPVSDPITGMTDSVTFVVAEPLALPPDAWVRDGLRSTRAQVSAVDLDGDGFDEVILSTEDRSVEVSEGGGLFVWQGTVDGPQGPPVFARGSEQPGARRGRDHAVGDFDGDGFLDLAVGEHAYADGASNNAGRVVIYRGTATGLDPDDPWTLIGEDAGDLLGYAVGACDIDGDGLDDLIAGSPGLDDDRLSPTVGQTGGVVVYLGTSTGPSLHGAWYGINDDDGLRAEAGQAIAVGDLDGDLGCDVAVGSAAGDAFDGDQNRGGVWLLRDQELLSGNTWRRIGHLAPTDTEVNDLGFQLAMGPAPGSTHDALFVGARLASELETRGGRVLGFTSDTLTSASSALDVAGADWILDGPNVQDLLGHDLALGPDALYVAAPRATPPGINGEHGVVYELPLGFPPAAVDFDAVPSFFRESSGGWLGTSIGVLANGDVAAWSSVVSHRPEGVVDGAMILFEDAVPRELELPTVPVGSRLGAAVAWVDLDGNGSRDPLAGAPGAGDVDATNDGGALVGFPSTPFQRIVPELDSAETLGQAVVPLGDLDGDGFDDVAVIGDGRNIAANLPAPYDDPDTCIDGARNRGGAIHVFLGTASGLSSEPSFVFFGAEANSRLDLISAAFDFDGDGATDLAVGSGRDRTVHLFDGPWNATAGAIAVRCDPERTFLLPSSNPPTIVRAIPSLDGDACDELAIATPDDDASGSNRGSVRIFKGCQPNATWTALTAEGNNRRMGSGDLLIDDLTGDGALDLAVGSVSYDDGPRDIGAVWFAPHDALIAFDNTASGYDLSGLTTEIASVPAARIQGIHENDAFGRSLSQIGDRLLIGRNGPQGAGGLEGWELDANGFVGRSLFIAGEAPWSGLATSQAADGSRLLLGAPHSSAGGASNGALYVFDLP